LPPLKFEYGHKLTSARHSLNENKKWQCEAWNDQLYLTNKNTGIVRLEYEPKHY